MIVTVPSDVAKGQSETLTTMSGDASALDIRIEGTGPPLVLVPGMDGTGRLFYRQVPLLARQFTVATFRLRDSARRMAELVEDVTQVIGTVAPDGRPAIVCGESFGGALALSLAVQRPECVRALVVINSFARFLPQHRLHAAIAGVRLMPWGAMPLVRRLTAAGMHSKFTHRTEQRRFLAETRLTTRLGYLNRLRILLEYDMRPLLERVAAPSLFVAADRDHLIPSVEQGAYMAARVPNARLHILEGHGHICLIAPNVDLSAIITDWGGAGV
jgi:pimeloyl-ACP methyl ester carboxylesterase